MDTRMYTYNSSWMQVCLLSESFPCHHRLLAFFCLSPDICLSSVWQKIDDSRSSCILLQYHTVFFTPDEVSSLKSACRRDVVIGRSVSLTQGQRGYHLTNCEISSLHITRLSYYSYVPATVVVTVTVPWACCCVSKVAREGCAGRSVACAIARCNS